MAREKIGDRVHGLGRCSNTEGPTPGIWRSKNLIEAYSNYNFVMAFENLKHPGYITEKILTPFIAGAIPVFYGEDDIANRIFNPKAFIRVSDFDSFEDCINYLIKLDNDEDKLNEIRNQPVFKDSVVPDLLNISDFNNPYYKEVTDYLRKTLSETFGIH